MDTTIKTVENPIMKMPTPAPAPAPTGPQFVLEQVPCLSLLVNMVWPTIKPYVQELAGESAGEFSEMDVFQEVMYGSAFLYMGYMVKDAEAYKKGEPVEKTFVAYAIAKLNTKLYGPDTVHVWQACIVPEYRNTNVFELGWMKLREEFTKMGAKKVSLSAKRDNWIHVCQKLGLKETFAVFRGDL